MDTGTPVVSDAESDDSVAMSAKKIELPDFWETQPQLWFARAAEEFSVKGVKLESTMYSYLVARLPMAVASRVHDELLDKDPEKPYTKLKERLIATSRRPPTSAQSPSSTFLRFTVRCHLS